MPKRGFFKTSELLSSKAPQSRVPACGACRLFKDCTSPKMNVAGRGLRGILIVGDSPSDRDDKKGKHFADDSGRLLDAQLSEFGIDMRKDCWLTNSLICKTHGDALPTEKQIGYCRPNILKTIEELKPTTVILLGPHALKSVVGHLWNNNPGSIERWLGWQIPSQKFNAWLCPTYHPQFILDEKENKKSRGLEALFFKKNLKAALKLAERPWVEVPDYRKRIKKIYDPKQAADHIACMMAFNRPIALDFETNCLKPDGEYTKIVSASMYDGDSAIAFPWVGEAIKQFRIFLQSKVPKIGANIKYEDRWARRHLGVPVKNFVWDTTLGAHVLDNRRSITSVKFQSFVLLGVDKYNDHIQKLLEAEGSKPTNKISEISMSHLLEYNAMDSIVEYHVACIQMDALQYDSRPKGLVDHTLPSRITR